MPCRVKGAPSCRANGPAVQQSRRGWVGTGNWLGRQRAKPITDSCTATQHSPCSQPQVHNIWMLARRLLQYQRSTRIPSFYRQNVSCYSTQGFHNLNEPILEMLRREKEREEEASTFNNFKINAFNKAIFAISQLREPIKSGDDEILELKGIGIGIKNRINEYFVQQDLASAQNSKDMDNALRRRAVLDLQRVPGVGAVKAKALVQAGCRGLMDLITSEDFHSQLSSQQITGLKYIEHLDNPVSREQVAQVLNICKSNLSSKYEIIPVGEYRRGLSECLSIKLMLLHPDHVHVPMPSAPGPFAEIDFDYDDPPSTTKRSAKKADRITKKDRENSLLHGDIVPLLQQRDVLFEKTSETRHSWTGVVRMPSSSKPTNSSLRRSPVLQLEPGDYRRISIHLVPQKSRASGLLNLTGDDGLNRHLKLTAEKMGKHLDEFGLWKWNNQKHTEVPIETAISDPDRTSSRGFWSLVKTDTEEDIFQELSIPYVELSKRNFDFLNGTTQHKPKAKKFSTIALR